MALVTLLSDFGSTSPYPAAMKTVLAALCGATLIDISHDVPRHAIWEGAYLLAAVAPHVPAGTVHLAVVDPGVGTARQALIVTSGGQFFVGPDNGLLLPAARRVGRPQVFGVTGTAIQGTISATFHGRDIFAPLAAHLARGAPVTLLAAPLAQYVDLDFGTGRRDPQGLSGQVIYVDPFGNLITNIPAAYLEGMTAEVTIHVGLKTVQARVARTYGDVDEGSVAILAGSDGFLEVAMREGSAAASLEAKARMPVRVAQGRGL